MSDDPISFLRGKLQQVSPDRPVAQYVTRLIEEALDLRARVTELLAANTREVERRRIAARKVTRAEVALRAIAAGASPVTPSTLAVLAMYDIKQMEAPDGP